MVNGSEQAFLFLFGERCNILKPFEHSWVFNIWSTDSLQAIESFKAGDSVYAYDVGSKAVVVRQVAQAYTRQVDRLIRLEYGDEIVYTTSEHPFYVLDKWVNAADLIPGDLLHLGERASTSLSKKTVIDTSVTVYNITVEEAHNYFVGNAKALVHNNNPCGQAAKRGMTELQLVAKAAHKAEAAIGG